MNLIKTAIDSVFGYREELLYDKTGNVLERKEYSKIDNQIRIEITSYKYDSNNNILELNRNSFPKEEYPIIMIGGRAKYENEKFRYVYNKDNLWIEKYWIVENTEYLIEKRKFN